MANITRTEAAAFIPTVWAQTALGYLVANLIIQKMTMQYTAFKPNQFASFGETLNLPKRGTLYANDKAEQTNYSVQNPTATTIALTLNKHKETTFMIERRAMSEVNQDVIGGYVTDAMLVLAEQVDKDILATWGSANTAIGTGIAVTEANLQAARKALVDNKAPAGMARYGVVNSQQVNNMMNIDRLVTYQNNGQANNIASASVGNGDGLGTLYTPYFGTAYNFGLFESQLVNLGTQVLTMGGGPTGGTFTLAGPYGGTNQATVTTAGIAYNAAAAAVQSALNAVLPANNQVTVTGAGGGPWTVTFAGATTAALTPNNASLTGGASPAVTVATQSKNLFFAKDAFLFASRPMAPIAPGLGVQTVSVTDPSSGVTLNLTYAYNAQAGAMQCTVEVLYGVAIMRPEHLIAVSCN